MKVIIIRILIAICAIHHISGETDYCKLCSNHIACNNSGTFDPSCPADAAVVDLTQSDKDLFVKVHNQLRNDLAGGLIPGFSSAANISVVTWDPELAYFAKLNLLKCKLGHDGCRRTEKYWTAGQNLWVKSGKYSQFQTISSRIEGSVNKWFSEYKSANQTQMSKCCYSSGHFTQVIQYRVVAIGCALVRFTDQGWKSDLIACNYSSGNLSPVYIPGLPASSCKNGTDLTYTNLCKI